MSRPRNAIFFDIDWTLYDHERKRFDPSGVLALRELDQTDDLLFLCSARPYDSMKGFGVFDLGVSFDGFIGSNGGVGYADGRFFYKSLLSDAVLKRFALFAKKLGVTYELVGPWGRTLQYPPTDAMWQLRSIYKDTIPPLVPYHGEEVVSLLLFAPASLDEIFAKEFPDLGFYRFSDCGVDVTSKPHEKGDPIPAILRHYHVGKKESYGFGDDLQDLSLAAAVGTFIAMGGAKEEVKKVASFVTAPIGEGGLYKGLAHYGLLPSGAKKDCALTNFEDNLKV